jgi:hypothetical protein
MIPDKDKAIAFALVAAFAFTVFWGAVCVYSVGLARLEAAAQIEVFRGAYAHAVTAVDELSGDIAALEMDAQVKDDIIKILKKELQLRPTASAVETVGLAATWYCGKSGNTVGAGGSLVSGKSIALNNVQRKALGVHYGDRVYITAPERYGLTGYWTVMDTGCREGIVDLYYRDRSDVPPAFRREGVVNIEAIIIKE